MLNGSWLKPPKRSKFHYRNEEADTFLCGLKVTSGIRRATENDFASYSEKCEGCLLKFYELEEASLQ
jgi:hypothetical protein